MRRAANVGALVTEVELALLAGCNLQQIESEILADGALDEESQAAAWLYAWCCEDRVPAQRLPF